ncbi:MAG: hypothetical protein LLF96_09275 [Eubacteriales bacterium]|nr:hypothetical protein [Eubacteriales bacterium]
MKPKDQCTVCGMDKECIHCHFGINNLNANPMPISDYMFSSGRANFARTLTLSVCDTCAKEKGKGPVKEWITLITAAVVYALLVILPSSSVDALKIFRIVFFLAALFTQLIAGFVLLFKGGFSLGKTLWLGLLQMLPFAGFLLLPYKRRIDLNVKANSVLKPVAKESFLQTAQKEAELSQKIENGEVTDEEVLREYRRSESRKQAQKEASVQKARSGRITYALFGIAITIFIILRGYGVYSTNSGYMTWFGINLTPVTFTLLVAAFLVYDVLAIVFAVRKRK